ncbi:MAG: 8-amino-7-oxononanoate synthase [Pedosphaera sp.]|nr:8-amino-7-oxononanoate synthase [Pedosphaera sp.]
MSNRAFESELMRRLDEVEGQGLSRALRRVGTPQGTTIEIDGRNCLNFSSNDYLGLASEPSLKEAAVRAIERFGAGSGASRLISGSLAPHFELEETLASFKGTEAALTFSSGYLAALGAICALAGKQDMVILDKLVHASIVDATRLSGAKLRVFAHNDLNDLEGILNWAADKLQTPNSKSQGPRVLIVTESVFSMDGDQAPLRELVELKDRYGAWLMVDEAHATGILGDNRRGLAEKLGVEDRVEIQMGTLGKAFGAAGGYIAGSRTLIDYLINRSRSFIFSTAPAPAAAAAATAGVRFVQSDAGRERVETLWKRVNQLASGAQPASSAILPLIIGDERRTVEVATTLREQGIFIPAIRYPSVARGAARLRITVNARHTREHIDQLRNALEKLGLMRGVTQHKPSGDSIESTSGLGAIKR